MESDISTDNGFFVLWQACNLACPGQQAMATTVEPFFAGGNLHRSFWQGRHLLFVKTVEIDNHPKSDLAAGFRRQIRLSIVLSSHDAIGEEYRY